MAETIYSIKENRIKKACMIGMELLEDGRIHISSEEGHRYLFLPMIDSAGLDSNWGRFSMNLSITENMAMFTHVVALNEEAFYRKNKPTRIEKFLCDPTESAAIKKDFFAKAGGQRFVNQKDILLYSQKGRYLYLAIEIIGEGEGYLSDMKVDRQGDNFMQTFPEVYQEYNGFFHRYLSVFSSIYNDFQDEIERLPEYLELDTCPKELLPMIGGWLGIDVNCDIEDENVLRALVKEAYHLNCIKGTKEAVSRICEIVLGEEVIVIERNAMREYEMEEDAEQYQRIFGDSAYDVTILIRKKFSETLGFQLMYLLEQYIPIRTRIQLVHLRQDGLLDSHSYLDMNARVFEKEKGKIDTAHYLDDAIVLQ